MNDLVKSAVWQTLFYARAFERVLTPDECWKRLIKGKRLFDEREVRIEINRWVKQGLLVEKREWVFWWPEPYFPDVKLNRQKWKLAKTAVTEIKKLPFVKGVAITGSLAFDNCEANDDIDFLIVTQKNRVYLGRFFCYLLAWWKQKKRQIGRENNSWCFNVFLAENNLKIPLKKQTLYSAYQLKTMRPLWESDDCLTKMQLENKWLENYFNCAEIKIKKEKKELIIKKEKENCIFDLAEMLMREIQVKYMRKRITREIVTKDQLFFHPLLRGVTDLNELQQSWQNELQHWQIDKNGELPHWLKKQITVGKNEIGLVTGVFDLCHIEHLNFIEQAKKQTQCLVIGIESDLRVKAIKGVKRPFYSQEERRLRLQNKLKNKAIVVILPDNFGELKIRKKVLKQLRVKKLFVSGEDDKMMQKQAQAQEMKIDLRVIEQKNHLSMSAILQDKKLANKLIFAYDREKVKNGEWKE